MKLQIDKNILIILIHKLYINWRYSIFISTIRFNKYIQRQLQELIESQEAEIISINEQMVELDKTNKGILPKLEEMVNTLKFNCRK